MIFTETLLAIDVLLFDVFAAVSWGISVAFRREKKMLWVVTISTLI